MQTISSWLLDCPAHSTSTVFTYWPKATIWELQGRYVLQLTACLVPMMEVPVSMQSVVPSTVDWQVKSFRFGVTMYVHQVWPSTSWDSTSIKYCQLGMKHSTMFWKHLTLSNSEIKTPTWQRSLEMDHSHQTEIIGITMLGFVRVVPVSLVYKLIYQLHQMWSMWSII